jgi:hypothetical protein
MMAAFLQKTTVAAEQESGGVRELLANPLFPSWLAAIFAFLALIPLGITAVRLLRRRWETRHLPRNTQVDQDRANYVKLLDKYEGYLALLRNLLILRSQMQWGNVEGNPDVERQFVQKRDALYQSIRRRGDNESDMGDLQKLDILESRNVGINDLRQRRRELEELQAEVENHPLFIPRDSSED